MTLLEINELVGGYGASEQILKGANLAVEDGEIVTIIGPNGAGKSTLLKAVAGLVATKGGTITLGGRDLTPIDAIARSKAGISFVPQEHNVFGTLSVLENLSISCFTSPGSTTRKVEEAFDRYPMLATKRRSAARTLSGGQRQILAMAMGLMTDPKLILLDEPTAGLSPKAAQELFEAVLDLNRGGMPVLMVEQHAIEALEISTRGYVLVAGRTEAEGRGPDLASDPEVRRLFLGG